MIIYATKQTMERFKLKQPEEMSDPFIGAMARSTIELERGDALLEWGAKLFYFDRRKCMQVTNFASRLTFFLVDIKLDDLPDTGNAIATYMMDLYRNSAQMKKLLERFFKEHPFVSFSNLMNRSIIAALNWTQRSFLNEGYTLYRYIRDGILHTKEVNRDVNRYWCFSRKENGKTIYFQSAEYFEQLLRERYQVREKTP